MQRYYHKGAFYVEEGAEVLSRVSNEPTLEDRFDREALPEVMQVKNFGRTSQVKWTHLSKEDTSQVKTIANLFLFFSCFCLILISTSICFYFINREMQLGPKRMI